LEILTKLGAIPINIPWLETYTALERGIADGVLCPIAPMKGLKLTEVTPHHTILNLQVSPFFAVMNQSKWNSLSPQDQKIIDELSKGTMSKLCGTKLREGDEIDSKWMSQKGEKFYELSPEEIAKCVDAIKPLREKFISDLEAKGLPGKKILEEILRLAKQY